MFGIANKEGGGKVPDKLFLIIRSCWLLCALSVHNGRMSDLVSGTLSKLSGLNVRY